MDNLESTTKKGEDFEKKVLRIFKSYIDGDKYYVDSRKCILLHKYVCKKEDNNYRNIKFDIVIKMYNTVDERERAEKGENIKHASMIVIECKNHTRKISSTYIENFNTLITNSTAQKGILVSNKGFAKEAIQIAKKFKIDLAIINENDDLIFKRKEDNYVYYSLYELLLALKIIDNDYINYSKIKIPYMEELKIIDIINNNFNYLDIYSSDRLNTEKLIKFIDSRFGLKCEFNSCLDGSILGFIAMKKSKIFISNKLEYDDPRWRFTFAHEIGHFILHRSYLEKYIDFFEDKVTDIIFESDVIPRNINKRMEIQANLFASNLLINNLCLEAQWSNFKKQYFIVEDYLFLDNQKINKNRAKLLVEYIGHNFNVSKQVAIIKLMKNQILDLDKSIFTKKMNNIFSVEDYFIDMVYKSYCYINNNLYI